MTGARAVPAGRWAASRDPVLTVMTATFLSAWILFPLVLLVLSLGCGLLVRRIGGNWLAAELVLPVGFTLVIALCAVGTSMSWLSTATGWMVVAFATVGFIVHDRRWLHVPRRWLHTPARREIPWAAVAGIVVFLVFAAPALLTGTATITGYTRIVDTAFQVDFAKYLAEAARVVPPNDSSYHDVLQKILPEGYPGGGQGTLGAISALIRTDVPWCYQSYLAFAAAMAGVAACSLLRRVTTVGLLAGVGAIIAVQPNLLYGYALEGGIKELTTASALVTVVAVLAQRLPGDQRGPPWKLVPIAVPLAAAIASFSFGILPWVGILFAGLFVVTLVRAPIGRPRVIADWASLLVLTLLIALPSVITSIKLAGIAGAAVGGVINLGLGNLAYPIPAWGSAGIWLTGDYRFPIAHVTATHALAVGVIALGVIGIVFTLRHRRWAVAMLGIGTPIALYYWVKHAGVWVGFKSFTITGVFALILAFCGLAALVATRRRPLQALGWLGVVVLSGAVLYGNALTYHDEALLPAARYRDLAQIGDRFAGRGPALYPAFDEWAEYFLRREDGSDTVNPSGGVFDLAPGVQEPGGVGFWFDLNQIAPKFLQTFPLIVVPRGPINTRAPSNYDLAEQTPYFDVWQRVRPAADVYVHLPLSGSATERGRAFCAGLATQLRRAGPGAEVAYLPSPLALEVSPLSGVHPHYWTPIADAIKTVGAGYDTMTFAMTTAGAYTLWMRGSVGRPMHFTLDGRPIGTLAYDERYPGEWLQVDARLQVSAGSHVLRVTRGNGSLHPGSGDGSDLISDLLGPLIFLPQSPATDALDVVPASAAQRVCSARVGYQWMEVVLPGAVPANAAHPLG